MTQNHQKGKDVKTEAGVALVVAVDSDIVLPNPTKNQGGFSTMNCKCFCTDCLGTGYSDQHSQPVLLAQYQKHQETSLDMHVTPNSHNSSLEPKKMPTLYQCLHDCLNL